MGRLHLCFAAALIVLASCGEASEKPAASATPAEPAGPPAFADIIANPASYIGKPVEFPIVLAAGDVLFVSGEKATHTGQAWNDPSGKENSVAPPPGYVAGKPCIFLVVNDDNTPVLPLQPIVVDNLSPCFAQSSFSSIKLTGTIAEVRDTQLLVDNQTATLKAPALTNIDFKTPSL
jgi:hypothetical protein